MQLRAWLESEDRTTEWLAEKIGRSPRTVRRWVAGKYLPRDRNDLRLIEELSDGQVTLRDLIFAPKQTREPGRIPKKRAA